MTITIPASHGLPEVQVPLVKEGGSCKIDIPDSVDAQKLQQNLQRQLTEATQQKDQWPADATAAYRAISHRVFAALMDEQATDLGLEGTFSQPGAAGQQPGEQQQQPQQPQQ